MKNFFQPAIPGTIGATLRWVGPGLVAALALFGASGVVTSFVAQAQRSSHVPSEVSNVTVQSSPQRTAAPAPQIHSDQKVSQEDWTRAVNFPPSEIQLQPQDDGLLTSEFSGGSVLVVMGLGVFMVFATRKRRARKAVAPASQPATGDHKAFEGELLNDNSQQGGNRDTSTSPVGTGAPAPNGSSPQSAARMQFAGPTSLYSAYRIDQEVGKLVLGQPHAIEVLASRSIDDRRAIETSLMSSANSPELDEMGQRRAREALEEYGFVARQCATLLLAPDAFERTTAARCLGDIKSPAALPFLLEGLYDSESIVRNQAVVSIGELKLPSAIGALLDIARKYPDVPSALLSRTLTACSVELDFFDAAIPEPASPSFGDVRNAIFDITHLEPPSPVEDLPATSDGESFARAIAAAVGSSDVEVRAEALKTLGEFRVKRAVEALSQLARLESEPNTRSMAISSLGLIDHESVFPAILIGMGDDSREVRASAARSLNRLSFDRADAYTRVIETSDNETIRNIAEACIRAGIVSQDLERLSSSDPRQAYETFSIICLLAKAKLNEPVLEVISNHPNVDVRLKAVHLLACTGQPEAYEQLRQLSLKDDMREEVKTALLEALDKIEQPKPCKEELVTDFEIITEPQFETPDSVALASELEPDLETKLVPEFETQFEGRVSQNANEFEF